MSEEKYTIAEIVKTLNEWTSAEPSDVDEFIDMLQRGEQEFVDGQLVKDAAGPVYTWDKRIHSTSRGEPRHLTPTEAGPLYAPVKEMKQFILKVSSLINERNCVWLSSRFKNLFNALPANLRGDSDD